MQQLLGSTEINGKDGAIEDTFEPGSKITAAALLTLLEQQEWKCSLTGRTLTPETAELDHDIPLSRGGRNTIENSQIVHRDANQAKRAMTSGEFVSLCREVVAQADLQT